jgi:integrase
MANKKALQLNDKMLKALEKPKTKKWIRDGGGLSLCLTTANKGPWRYWYFIYTSPETSKKCYKPLGTYPDIGIATARDTAGLLAAKVTIKIDPIAEERREMEARVKADKIERSIQDEEDKNITVAKLVTEYLEKHAQQKKKSWREDERILNKDVIPAWGNRKAKDIIRRDVLSLLNRMQGRGDGIVMNTFKIIRRMFRYAVKQEIIATTPCYAFEKGEELPRPVSKERNLSESEIKVFMTDLDNCAISQNIRNILKLILITGQRPGEVCAMYSSDIIGRWWEFTPKETKITKEVPRKQRIYLTDAALELIGPLTVTDPKTKETKPRGYIFKCHTDKTRCITEKAVTYALRRNLLSHEVRSKPATWKKTRSKPVRKSPFVITDDKKLDIEKFTPHDLRRTCATMISEIGFVDDVVDTILAHLKKGEIRTYNKNKYDKEKQVALEEWSLKLACIINGTEYSNRHKREDDKRAEEEKNTK